MKQLVDRILQISKDKGLTHIGSNLSVLPILEEIYEKKKPEDKVVLCNAHAHLAHLVVKLNKSFEEDKKYKPNIVNNLHETSSGIEYDENAFDEEFVDKAYIRRTKEIIEKYGIHCERSAGCDASGGSLGHGIGISIGMALSDRTKDVYVIVSDGSMQEGSSWEALHLANDLSLTNLHIYANLNGYTAVQQVDQIELEERILAFNPDVKIYFTQNGKGFEGVEGHYKRL